MISVRKVSHFDKRKEAWKLKLDGYISSVELSGLYHSQLEELGIDSRKFDNPKVLKQKFESDNNLRCICLDYGGRTKKYWYKIDDLCLLYPQYLQN